MTLNKSIVPFSFFGDPFILFWTVAMTKGLACGQRHAVDDSLIGLTQVETREQRVSSIIATVASAFPVSVVLPRVTIEVRLTDLSLDSRVEYKNRILLFTLRT